jgi:hypothetical protein
MAPNWIGSVNDKSVGILLIFFQDINYYPEEGSINELDYGVILKLIQSPGVVENLDISNKEYYLILQTNSTFYID